MGGGQLSDAGRVDGTGQLDGPGQLDGTGRLDQVSLLHLRYFLAVVDAGTVRAAAQRLRIAQPSLSQHVAALESRIGVRLFVRTPAGMTPTEAGARLAALATTFRADLASLALGAPAPCLVSVPRGATPAVLDAVRGRLGDSVRFVRKDSAEGLATLGSGGVDAAVVRGPMPRAVPGATAVELLATPLGALMRADHTLAARERLTWTQVHGERVLWFDERRAPEFAAELLGELRDHGCTPELVTVDTPSDAIFTDALVHRGLVALRPRPEPGGHPLLTWRPVDPPLLERLHLLVAAHRLQR